MYTNRCVVNLMTSIYNKYQLTYLLFGKIPEPVPQNDKRPRPPRCSPIDAWLAKRRKPKSNGKASLPRSNQGIGKDVLGGSSHDL